MRAAVGCASKAWNGSTSAADGTRPRGRRPRGGGRTQAGLSGTGTGRHATRRGRFRSTRCPLPDVERHGGGPLGGRVSPRGRKSPENVAPRGELHVHARLNGAPAASYQWIENMRPAAPPTGKGGMLEKRRNVIRGLAVAGMRRTGTAAKRPTLTHRSIASVPHGTKGVLARRDRRRASCAIRAAHRWHCTDARHGTVRTHPLQVCLAAADKAPIGFAHGRHRSRAAASAACAAGMDSPCKGIFFRTRMAVWIRSGTRRWEGRLREAEP